MNEAQQTGQSLSGVVREKLNTNGGHVPGEYATANNQGGRGIKGEKIGPCRAVRLEDDQFEDLRSKAETAGVSFRAYLRDLIIQALNKEQRL